MLCRIDTFDLADGTQAGGVALSNLRLTVERVFDIVVPLDGTADPVLYDRVLRNTDITFDVRRVHASVKDAEDYINLHEATVPQSGDVILSATDGLVTAQIVNARLISHELTRYIGKSTQHTYHIIGGQMVAAIIGTGGEFIEAETGDYILTETGDRIILE